MSERTWRVDSKSLGEISAEDERTALANYFVEQDEYRQVRDGDKWIILGQKGAGKSAMRFRLLSEQTQKFTAVDVPIDSFFWKTIQGPDARQKRADGALPRKHAWLAVFLARLAEDLQDEMSRGERRRLRRHLRRAGLSRRWLPWRVDQFRIDMRLLSANFVRADTSTSEFIQRTSEVEAGLEAVQKALAARKRRILLIDQLDDFFTPRPQDWAAIHGLFMAAEDLRSQVPMAEVRVFMREDMWSRLSFPRKDKLKGSTVHLRWTRRDLLAVVNDRLRYASHKGGWNDRVTLPHGNPDYVAAIFPDQVRNVRGKGGVQDLDRFVFGQVLRRPRDVLLFFKLSLDANRGRAPVPSGAVKEAAEKYSEIRHDNIVQAETVHHYPGLAILLQGLKGSRQQLKWPTLHKKMQQTGERFGKKAYLEALLEFEVLGKVGHDGKTTYYSDDAKVVNVVLNNDTTFEFHPSLRHYLGIKGIYNKKVPA